MPDFGQFPDPRTDQDRREAYKEAKEFYGSAPRIITVAECGNKAALDMDGCGYRCLYCFSIVGSVGCACTNRKSGV